MELRHRALDAFCLPQAHDKVAATLQLVQDASSVPLDTHWPAPTDTAPGRPERPLLVEPQAVPRRSPYTTAGHAALLHAIAHIEFNAINLALDAVWRFAGMPADYYHDWLRVAGEEAQHFTMLRQHLQSTGYDYGDFEAHDGLWTMCDNTRHDITARMALVPRTLEARGLDATPIIQAKLRQVGSPTALEAVSLLDIILRDEVGHVAIGNRWFHWLCERHGHEPHGFYQAAFTRYDAPRPKPPFNLQARADAGFTPEELAALNP